MEQPIHLAGARLGRHRHLCGFFDCLDEELSVVIPFALEGLERGEQVVFVVDPQKRADYLRSLQRGGIDVRPAERALQLEVRSWDEVYLVGGRFQLGRMLARLHRMLVEARSQGFSASRFICHMEWALKQLPGVGDFLEYESWVTRIFARRRDVAICIYDAKKFGGRQVVDIVRTHPMNIVGGVLQDDPFFSRPDALGREIRHQESESKLRDLQIALRRSVNHHGPVRRKKLRSTIRDLVGVLLVPTIWRHHEPGFIVEGLLELMTALVPLDVAFVSLNDESPGSKKYFCKTRPGKRSVSPKELALLLDGSGNPLEPFSIPHPFGEGTLEVMTWPLGVNGKWGTLAAGSSIGFRPSVVFMLRAASTQAVLALDAARSQALEAERSRLQAEAFRVSTGLAQLRAHLEPHFLLNTLNAIAGLVSSDPSEARQLLVALGDLLRDLLKDNGEMQTVEAQIAWLRRYAQILQIRHAGRLSFRWEIAPEAMPMLVPPLLLQPLVENAARHGALRRAGGGGEVIIRAQVVQVDGERKLVCSVEDNGPGFQPGEARPGARGIAGVERCLAYEYGEKGKLRFDSSPSGTQAIIELPAVVAGKVRSA